MEEGTRGDYQWFQIANRADRLSQLVKDVPNLIKGHYVAVTSMDSGPHVPTEEERARGWTTAGDVAYSPLIESFEDIWSENWDEWWVFNKPTVLSAPEVFINYGPFGLS